MASVAHFAVDWEVQQAYAAFSKEGSKNFTDVNDAIFKHYNINEETYAYHQIFWSATAKEGELPTEKVTHLMDMAAKWLKEHDSRAKAINIIVKE